MPKVLGIRKVSSVDFVRHVFESARTETLFAVLGETDALPDLPGYTPGEIIAPEAGGGWFDGTLVRRETDTPAQILFSSGTEGRPKAILVSYRALSDTVERLNSAMRVDASIREYIGVPVTFSFGLGRCRAVAAAGGRFYLPGRGFDPLEIRRMLENGEINAISAVPTLFRTVLQSPQVLGGYGSRVKWIELGSQYMSRGEKEQLKELFPNAVILQHYGLTEASRTTFLLISETEGAALESVGRPFGGAEVQTSDDGRIRIRGPHLASGLVRDGRIDPLVDADGWLTTGDNGHFEGDNLFFDGRADDIINSGGLKVDPAQLEQDVLGRLGAEGGIAIAGIADPARGEGFFVAVREGQGLDPEAVEAAVDAALRERGIVAGSSVRVREVGEIPTTGTGKVQRKALAALYRDAPDQGQALTDHSPGAGVLSLFRHSFGRDDIEATASFQDLGGDSLNYVQMSIALEKELGTVPANWDSLPIAELQTHQGGAKPFFAAIESAIVLRAVAITAVVATHAGWIQVRGGTFLLFFLIGYNLARFKSSDLAQGNVWEPLFSFTKVLLVPYFLLAAIYMVIQQQLYVDLLFLYTNLVERRLTVLFPFWFVQVLVQCLILTGLLFLIPAVRDFAAKRPWLFAFTVTILLSAAWFASRYVWNTNYLNNLVPQRYITILWIGWCCYLADTPLRRALTMMLAILVGYQMAYAFDQRAAWIISGAAVVLYLPTIRLPDLMRRAAQIVASATFQIFVFNGVIIFVLARYLGVESDAVKFVAALLGSLAASWVIDRVWAAARRGRKTPAPSAPM